LEHYWKKNKGRAFKKNEVIKYLEEQLDENKEFIKECIKQLKKDGSLYAPDHILQFSEKFEKNTSINRVLLDKANF